MSASLELAQYLVTIIDGEVEVDMQRVRSLFNAGASPYAYDMFLKIVMSHFHNAALIREFLSFGAFPGPKALTRAIMRGNAPAVHAILDHTIMPYVRNSFDMLRSQDMKHVDECTIRTLVFHPRVNTLPIDDLQKVLPEKFWPVLDELDAEQSLKRTVRRTSLLKEELMKITWHPARHIQWCLAHDDVIL